MKKNTDPLFPERFYHIYNRGNNSTNLFLEQRNYTYFLNKLRRFVGPVANIYAYCLLKNHFHLMIQTKTETAIRDHYSQGPKYSEAQAIEALISKGFNSFFKSYSVTINKTYNRTGRLFEEPFLRIQVTSRAQITRLILYIHTNAQKAWYGSGFS